MPLMSLSSCVSLGTSVVPETGHFYLNPYTDLSDLGRVAVLELDNRSSRADLSLVLTDAITESLAKKHLFGIQALHSDHPDWRNLGLDDSGEFTHEKLLAIRKQLKVNAIVFGTITQYYPYPHMLMALRLKMIDLRDGRLLWAMEQVWDSTDKRVEQRMKIFFSTQMRSGYQPMNWDLLITSPRAFNKFVVHEVAQTFPSNNSYTKLTISAGSDKNFNKTPQICQNLPNFPQNSLKFTGKSAIMNQ